MYSHVIFQATDEELLHLTTLVCGQKVYITIQDQPAIWIEDVELLITRLGPDMYSIFHNRMLNRTRKWKWKYAEELILEARLKIISKETTKDFYRRLLDEQRTRSLLVLGQ